MTVATTICFVILGVAAALYVARIVRPGTLVDRLVALDSMLIAIVSGISVLTARTGSGTFVTVLVVTSLVAFVSTISVARFVERRGA